MWGLLRTLVAYSQIWEGLYSSGGPWLVFREGPLLAADIYAIRPGVDSLPIDTVRDGWTKTDLASIPTSPLRNWGSSLIALRSRSADGFAMGGCERIFSRVGNTASANRH